MRISLYTIDKGSKEKIYTPLLEHYRKSCMRFATVEIRDIFTKEIAKAHDISADAARGEYTKAFEKYLKKGYSIALDPGGRELNSQEFSNLLKDRSSIGFYIGGAFGLERDFLEKCDMSVSLGKITLSHKVVKIVVMEQIFRALTIINNHPYHK